MDESAAGAEAKVELPIYLQAFGELAKEAGAVDLGAAMPDHGGGQQAVAAARAMGAVGENDKFAQECETLAGMARRYSRRSPRLLSAPPADSRGAVRRCSGTIAARCAAALRRPAGPH